MSIIDNLKNQFIQEALSSPILFNDLANMEKYISESYQMRSIIELLQNADDAGSGNFKILLQDSTLYVANDGRNFSGDDLISICRSGASTKKDRDLYIGYRGIGFKSVVNFAKTIHIVSDDLSFTFSKERTVKLLKENNMVGEVPLIRVPHTFETGNKFNQTINTLKRERYSVVFIFEDVQIDVIKNEIKDFSPNTLLFLKNVKAVTIDTGDRQTNYEALRTQKINHIDVIIKENSNSTLWSVIKSNKRNSPEAIAYPVDEQEKLVSKNEEDFLVFAFLPTKVNTGFNFILNGAFNTDPSRTQVILDEQTRKSINNAVQLITLNVKTAIEDPLKANNKLISLVSKLTINPVVKFKSSLSFSDVLKEELIKALKNMKLIINSSAVNVASLYNRPEWLNAEDYKLICEKLKLNALDIDLFKLTPSLKDLFNSLDLKKLTIDMLITQQKTLEFVSVKGRSEILVEYIKNNRFSFNTSKIDILRNTVLFKDLKDEAFREFISSYVDNTDLCWFLSKLDIQHTEKSSSSHSIPIVLDNKNKTKKFSSKFSKWRAAEINVKSYFESLEDVVGVIDVSKSNLGYDLEVQRKNYKEYIEVKSVTNLGDSFSLTNNEYGVANELKENYFLAVAKQSDSELELCLIPNPVETLKLNRRVTRWEWVCDEYFGEIKQISLD